MLTRIVVQVITKEQIAMTFEPVIAITESITVRTANGFVAQLSKQLGSLQPIKIGKHIESFHGLFFFRCSLSLFQTQIP